MPTLQHHDVRVLPGGFHILLVHGLDRGEVLGHHRLKGPAPLLHIPESAAEDADVGIGLHEDLDVEHIPQSGVLENQNALHDDDLVGIHRHCLVSAVVVHIGVHRALDGAACLQLFQMLDEQIRVEGAGVIVVYLGPFLIGLALLALIVAVVADDGDAVTEVFFQVPGQGGFAGTCAAGNADQNRAHRPFSSNPREMRSSGIPFALYYNAYSTKPKALKSKTFKAVWLCSGARFLEKIV